MSDHDQFYGPHRPATQSWKPVPRTRRLSRAEREQRARLVDHGIKAIGWPNTLIARWLKVSETFVRKFRSGEKTLADADLALLVSRGLEVQL